MTQALPMSHGSRDNDNSTTTHHDAVLHKILGNLVDLLGSAIASIESPSNVFESHSIKLAVMRTIGNNRDIAVIQRRFFRVFYGIGPSVITLDKMVSSDSLPTA
jgi:hypothetical protein